MPSLVGSLVGLVAAALWWLNQALPAALLRRVPAISRVLSAVGVYFYAQAMGLLWVFAVSLFAACGTQGAEAVAGGASQLRFGLASLPALVFIYYSVCNLVVVCSWTMWVVMWESYHNYPTVRLMLLGPRGRRDPQEAQVSSVGAAAAGDASIWRRQVSPREAYNKVYVLRRKILLATPLLIVMLLNTVMLLGQALCEGSLDGPCSHLQCFNPRGRLNRSIRFVLFVALVQWFQVFTALFPTWHLALLRSRSCLARVLECVVVVVLAPAYGVRLAYWLLRPADAYGTLSMIFGLSHQCVDTMVVTGWAAWLLAVSGLILVSPENLRHSGFSIKKLAEESVWALLSSSIKFTQSIWLLLAWVRGCVKAGFAHAQSDIIFTTVLYPWIMLFIWSVVITLIACLRTGWRTTVTLLVLAGGFVASVGVGWLVCAFAGREDSPLLVGAVGVHVACLAFGRVQSWLQERRRSRRRRDERSAKGAPRPPRARPRSASAEPPHSDVDSSSAGQLAPVGEGGEGAEQCAARGWDSDLPRQTSGDTDADPPVLPRAYSGDTSDANAATPERWEPVEGRDGGGGGAGGGEPAGGDGAARGLPRPPRAGRLPRLSSRSVSVDFAAVETEEMVLKEEVFKSSETERRFAEAAFQTLMLICLTFVCTLTCMLLLGSVQQRAGLIAADVMSWSGTPAGVEIVNAAVSHLKLDATPLGKAGMQDAPDADAASVLPPGSTPSYALCGSSWYGLSPLDYALLAGVSYMTPNEKNDLPALMRRLMPNRDVTIRKTPATVRRWLEFSIRTCANASSCSSVTVVAISGTDPTRIEDYAENIRMWTEPVALQILSVFFPIVRTWPREATAELIGLTRAALRSMALQDDRWHYQEVLEHVAGKPPGETVVLTGHSLGGGMALVVGALTGRLAVALQPPGVYHSLAKHQTDRAINGDKAVHQRSVTLKFEGDWIQHFDDHGGLVQTMACDRSHQGVQLACHMVEGAVCHLLRHCGDEEQRFWRCSHEYAPSSALREVLNALGAWLRQIWVRSRWRREEMFGDLWAKVVSAVCISVAFLLRPQRGPTPTAEGAAARRQEGGAAWQPVPE